MIYGIRTWNQIGDSAIVTGAVHNVKLAYPELRFNYIGPFSQIWANNPDVTKEPPQVELPIVCYGDDELELTGGRGNVVEANTRTLCEHLHISCVPIVTKTPYLPLTDEEKRESAQWNGCWLLNANCQNVSRSKGYPYWQQVVDLLKGLKIVQVGSREKRNLSPDLSGVTDHRGKSENLRSYLSMIYGCDGIISPPSGIMNIGAAYNKRMVIVTGAREPVSVTNYDNTEYVTSECCGFNRDKGCFCQTFEKIRPCRNWVVRNHQQYSRCMDMIEPERIAQAVRRQL